MLIRRSELRLALAAGLMNGFGALAPVPFGFYAPMAVLVVCTGTYGGSIGLGRQRLLGSVAGALVLLVSYAGLQHLPIPLGLSLSLIGMRLLGAALGLEVGYKVGSNIIVMGWLVHDSDLDLWVPVRLFWTVAGILVALLSLRLFWPDLAVDGNRRRLCQLLTDLGAALTVQAERIGGAPSPGVATAGAETVQRLRRELVCLRGAMPAVADELGNNPTSHPTYRLFEVMNGAGSQLVGVVDGLRLLPHAGGDLGPLGDIQAAEAELLKAVAERLEQWSQRLAMPHRHRPPPPAAVLETPARWQAMERWLHDPDLESFELHQLQRNASRLLLCGQALRSIEQAEQRWQILAADPR
ncbi:FUSC family protein [Synechococcus sp. CCY 9618]|uniref:FUSC family protein n=1 Tax=Synechococcus sp. CCY 9618 TaxID=2815602 RepID=UPI001C21CB2F|nr:FUSC family protein [Synechococcus sp. CCY 9618]